MKLSDRELAMILSALRYWRDMDRAIEGQMYEELDILFTRLSLSRPGLVPHTANPTNKERKVR